MKLKVNAELLININTIVDTEDPMLVPYSKEAIVKQAITQILSGNYEDGDPIDEPKINWIQCEECGQDDGLHYEECSAHTGNEDE